MSLEDNILKIIQEQMESDLIEKVIKEQLEKCVQNAISNLFGNWGDCTKVIEKKIKEVLIPQIEGYDYSTYIVKLDTVLTDILRKTTLDNKQILENFNEFYVTEIPKRIKISELFDKYAEHVSKYIDTSNLEVNIDDNVSYENANINIEIKEESKSWSIHKTASIHFECEEDESLNFTLHVQQSSSDSSKGYFITDDLLAEFVSIKRATPFQLFLLRMRTEFTYIDFDIMNDMSEVEIEEEPQATFS